MLQKPTYEELAQRVAELEIKQKTLEEEKKTFKENQERYRALIESSTDLIYVIDIVGKIKYMNNTIEKYGHSAEMMLGRDFRDFIHPEFHESVDKAMKDLLSQPGRILKFNSVKITEGKTYFFADVIYCYLPDTPKIEGIISV
ncbi:PAS domain-containing protein [bacterium]|nr:PAS domain-containing protein [bacterium]